MTLSDFITIDDDAFCERFIKAQLVRAILYAEAELAAATPPLGLFNDTGREG